MFSRSKRTRKRNNKTKMTIAVDLNDEEKETVRELQNRMKGDMEPEMLEDEYLLLRFLKAQDFNINNAEAMLRKHLDWREKNDIKNILKFKKTEVMEKYICYETIGYDKEGCLIRYLDGGNMDFRGLLASVTSEDLEKLAYYETQVETEALKNQSKKLGRNIDKCVYIENYENFTFAKATDKKALYFIMLMVKMYVNNYPERLKAAYLINVSRYFLILFTVVKTLVPKTILDKVQLYSDDSYKEDLLKAIDADVLPAFLGGKRTDPDGNPLCLTFINRAELVPESYYLSNSKKAFSKAADVQKITLSNAAFHEVKIEVKEPGSYLEWEFETKCRDIGFGLFYQELVDGEEKITEIVPIERLDTELYPETGTFRCDVAGTYVIVFDNTYSWVRAKEIYYRTKVVTPNEHESAQIIE